MSVGRSPYDPDVTVDVSRLVIIAVHQDDVALFIRAPVVRPAFRGSLVNDRLELAVQFLGSRGTLTHRGKYRLLRIVFQ